MKILIAALSAALLILTATLLIQSWTALSPYERIMATEQSGYPGKHQKPSCFGNPWILCCNLDSMRASLGDHHQAIRAEEWRRWLFTGSNRPAEI